MYEKMKVSFLRGENCYICRKCILKSSVCDVKLALLNS